MCCHCVITVSERHGLAIPSTPGIAHGCAVETHLFLTGGCCAVLHPSHCVGVRCLVTRLHNCRTRALVFSWRFHRQSGAQDWDLFDFLYHAIILEIKNLAWARAWNHCSKLLMCVSSRQRFHGLFSEVYCYRETSGWMNKRKRLIPRHSGKCGAKPH